MSISDFLTLFSARTRTWFWERRPGYALGVACIIATGSSTILSLFWEDIVGRSEEIGRPMLYGTTGEFLRTFGIASISDLPQAKDLKAP